MGNVSRTPPPNVNKAAPLILKLRGDVTRSPKQGYQWPHKKDLCPPKIFKKDTLLCRIMLAVSLICDRR